MSEGKDNQFPVHWVSKNARYRIIELMLSTRSITELARVLGVSPTAVRKYIKRISHPSDEILSVAIKHAETYEKEAIMALIIEDLMDSISKFYNAIDEKHKNELREKLAKTLGL
ncbi:MAG: helix-turn-helix domain-containing protein [Desulfurococcaceae archaeon]